MGNTAIGLLLALAVTNVMGGSYLITYPKSIIRGTPFEINVDILNTSSQVSLEAAIHNQYYNESTRKWEVDILQRATGSFSLGNSGVLSLPIENTFVCPRCVVHVRGRGALQFEREESVRIHTSLVSVLIQTDKAIYKPGQIVRYRAFAVYPDLQMYSGLFNIIIKDPNNNKIKIENGVRNESGVVEGSLQLSDQPPYGDWAVTVSLDETSDYGHQVFTVQDYKLPRFEIKVDLPPYILLSSTEVIGHVEAKYTFGQPVKGRVELRVGPDRGLDSCGKLPPAVETTFEIDGKAEFRVPISDITRVTTVSDGRSIRVTAFVKEAATGVRLNGSHSTSFYRNEYDIKFLENTPDVFKPGLPYTAFVQVYTPDNMPPPAGRGVSVGVYAYATYSVIHPEMELYGLGEFTGTYPLPGYNVTLPENGVLPIGLEVPDNATSISIQVHYQGRSAMKTVSKPYSKSNNFLQLTLENKNLKPGDKAMLRLQGTEPLNTVNYVILSRGSVLSTGSVDGQGQVEVDFTLPVTAELAPTSHLLAYYTRNSDEVVADSIAFNVDGIFSNEVSVAFSEENSEPGKSIDLVVTADPDSQVNVLAVDQSVLLLKSGNDITEEKVTDAISNFDPNQKPSDSDFALSKGAGDIAGVFDDTGLEVITDVRMAGPSRRNQYHHHEMFDYNSIGASDFGLSIGVPGGARRAKKGPSRSSQAGQPDVQEEKIRKIFPEAWLWQKSDVGDDGRAVFSTIVPDTITSWIASAFATNPQSGLGVAPTTSKLTVFRPFFVSLTYPSTIKKGEIAVIQATVFNYLPQDAEVTVELKGSKLYQNAPKTEGSQPADASIQSVRVPADEQRTVFYPIAATDIGVGDIQVTARSRFASDAVQRQIVIEPEGAPVSFNYPFFVSLDQTGSFKKKFSFPLPPHVVKGSEKARVKVSGDLIGPSLANIQSLLSLPTGCGEQSMVRFAPVLYIAQYLKATDQMSEYWENKVLKLLSNGYQRQLSYQRYDGSFSAFGNLDESGSTWLTAFVGKTLNEARSFIYVDPEMLIRIVDWVLDTQNMDGSFNELGRVLDPNTQGQHAKDALTAYILVTLVQTQDLVPTSECDENSFVCNRAKKMANATMRAVAYLESKFESVDCPYTTALISYALAEAKSIRADDVLNKLLGMAQQDGALAYWTHKEHMSDKEPMSDSSPSTRSRFLQWSPPRIQQRPFDILTTSYALLTFTSLNRIEEGLDALTWLTSQRNSRGGFASTQDTVVALQALATIATRTISPSSKLKIRVTGDRKRLRFRINQKNALELQVQEFKRVPKVLDIQIDGKGVALTEVDYHFNVNKELSTPSFDVSTVLLDDDIDSFNLMICTKWLWDRKTGMVVQEIGIPSGFSPDLTTLGSVVGMKRSERRGNVVAIYFDEIGKTSTCYSLLMTRTDKVAKSQPSFVRTYDYYEPGDQSTVFYLPKKLKQATVEDVCPKC